MEDFANRAVEEFLDLSSARSPTPGGGSVTALAGALGVALSRMVFAYSINKKTGPEARSFVEDVLGRLQRVDHLLRALITADALAYEKMATLAKQAREDAANEPDYQDALRDAIAVPMEIAALATQAASIMDEMKVHANKYLLSDLGIAVVLADAAVRSSRYTVQVNLPDLKDTAARDRLVTELDTIVDHCIRHCASVERFVKDHLEKPA